MSSLSNFSNLEHWHPCTFLTKDMKVKTFHIPDTFKWIIIREVTLLKDCYDEQDLHYFDIKKQQIPNGTTLKVKYRWANYYGTFFRCYYNNTEYDINACDCKIGPLEIGEFIGVIPDDYGKSYWRISDWDPRHDGYTEINLEEYIEQTKKKLSEN